MKFTKECNLKAREFYLKAIELDKEYARAYGSLAWTYITAYDENWSDEPDADLDKALEIARQGVGINPSSHSNHLVLARVFYYKKMIDRASESCQRAIELNPNDPDAFTFYAAILSHQGKFEQAEEQIARAIAMNPNLGEWNRGVYGVHAVIYYNARRYEDSIAAWQQMDNPPFLFYRWAAAAYAMHGNAEKARHLADKYLARYPKFDFEEHIRRMPYSHAEDREHYAEGLTKAGFARVLA